MPGFATHYLFGLTSVKSAGAQEFTNCIKTHAHAYSLGLQGPDLFFYHLPSYLAKSGNIGSLAHKNNTDIFLYYLLESRGLFPDAAEQNIASAYIFGFLAHYTLDTTCHPYIYAKSHYGTFDKDYFGHHVYLESDIDAELLLYYKGCLPSEFRQNRTIAVSAKERHVIAAILHYVYRSAYPQYKFSYHTMDSAIRSMHFLTGAMRDPSGKKKVLARKLEAKTLGYAYISPLITSDSYSFTVDPLNMRHYTWRNPWDSVQAHRLSFFDLLDEAKDFYLEVCELASRTFSAPLHTPIYQKRLKLLLHVLGGKSYNSGLPCPLITD